MNHYYLAPKKIFKTLMEGHTWRQQKIPGHVSSSKVDSRWWVEQEGRLAEEGLFLQPEKNLSHIDFIDNLYIHNAHLVQSLVDQLQEQWLRTPKAIISGDFSWNHSWKNVCGHPLAWWNSTFPTDLVFFSTQDVKIGLSVVERWQQFGDLSQGGRRNNNRVRGQIGKA